MEFPSRLIEDAVNAFAALPGIGKKTALRLVLHLMKQSEHDVNQFGDAVVRMRKDLKFCKKCHNVADDELCSICSNPQRNQSVVCIVETLRDIIAIENTDHYNGLYHILGGVISPIDGIGPEDLNIDSLMERISEGEIKEIIMALSPTIEGDTTIFYLSRRLTDDDVHITTIARGVSFGEELEYTDEFTLARSIVARLPYENYLVKKE